MPDEERREFATYFPDARNPVSLEDARASDANVVMAQYRRNGTMPRVNVQRPLWGDFSGPQDLMQQIERVEAARDRFRELPADVRRVSDHDPVRFLEMFEDQGGRAQLEQAGLLISDEPDFFFRDSEPQPATPPVSGNPPVEAQPPTEEPPSGG